MNSKKSNRFSLEVRERAIRMVQEHRGEYPSRWACIESIAPKIGCVAQTLHEAVKQQEVDAGVRSGLGTDEREHIKALERENKDLRPASSWPAHRGLAGEPLHAHRLRAGCAGAGPLRVPAAPV